jgi:hypothetical protein
VDFFELLAKPGARASEVATCLDAMTHGQRVDLLPRLDRAVQKRLYTLASLSAPVGVEHFVPAEVEARCEVRHLGRNTLPLPRAHTRFEKRFCRAGDGSGRLFGYNEAPSRDLIGPGYFVARPVGDDAVWASRGDVVIDYFEVPDGPVAPTWPAVVSNKQGLQRFVYHGTRDFMRRVSQAVSIGAAYKGERSLGSYFVLVRED